jgi:hypothetical protein
MLSDLPREGVLGNLVSDILRQHYRKGLCGKLIHPTQAAAEEAMRTTVEAHGTKHLRSGKRKKQFPAPYFCEGCQGWHWGHSWLNPIPTSMRDFYEAKLREGSSALTSRRCEEV